MKIKELLEISPADLTSLDVNQLQRIAKQSAKYTNTRIKNLVSTGNKGSFAYQKLSAKTRNANKVTIPKTAKKSTLINIIQNNQDFLKDRTSTVSGWKKEIKDVQKEYGKKYKRFVRDYKGHIIPEAVAKKRYEEHKKDRDNRWQYYTFRERQWSEMWEMIGHAREDDKRLRNFPSGMVKMVGVEIFKEFPNISYYEFLKLLYERTTNEYEQYQEERRQQAEKIYSGLKSKIFK